MGPRSPLPESGQTVVGEVFTGFRRRPPGTFGSEGPVVPETLAGTPVTVHYLVLPDSPHLNRGQEEDG